MPFASMEMKQFAQDWNFELATSSPIYPKSNGQSERYVQTVKQMMRKVLEDGEDIHLALLNYRDSPIAGLEHSPSQLLMSRRLKTKLPVVESELMPSVVSNANDLQKRQDTYKRYYDRGTKQLSNLAVGDSVRVLQGRRWEPAVVSNTACAPRSYIVTTPRGYSYRRNRYHLQDVNEPPPVVQPVSPSDDSPSHNRPQVPDVSVSNDQRLADSSMMTETDLTKTMSTQGARRSTRVSKLPAKFKDFEVNIK